MNTRRNEAQTGVFVVDDHDVIHQGIARVCEESDSLHFLGSATSPDSALRQLTAVEPAVVILDLMLGGTPSWALCQEIVHKLDDVHVIIYSAFGSGQSVETALNHGASGYQLKTGSVQALDRVIAQVIQGGTVIDPALTTDWVRHRRNRNRLDLDRRQIQILASIADGKDNYQIAEELTVSYHTVKFHISKMLKMSGETNRAGLVRFGKENFLIP